MKTAPLFRLTPLAAALLASFTAQAQLPNNPVLLNGAATIDQTATGLRVSNLPGTIINWDSFNIGANRSVEFAQISANSAVLNRVTGNTRSEILGALTSNGRVFLLNPNGVLFGQGARVDVQGLVASTLDLSNEDFLAGNYRFVCTNDVACDFSAPDAQNPTRNRIVLADGSEITTRTAGNGGQVWLIARGAVQAQAGSRIDAPLGQVAMAAGREVVVTSPSLGAITFTLDRIAGSQIDLAGDIDVERGAVGFFADSIRFAGRLRVPQATDGAGQIVASAGTRIDVADDARLNVSGAANANGGAVRLQATQTVRVSTAAEIAADGGRFTAAAPGGAGGVITLEAAEVILPSMLGNDNGDSGPIQLHARGQGAEGLELARYGRITVTETGNFDYTVIEGPSFLLDQNSQFASRSTRTADLFSSGSTSTNTTRGDDFRSLSVAGDGSILLISRNIVADQNSSETLVTRAGQPDDRTFSSNAVGVSTYRVDLVNTAGEIFATVALGQDTREIQHNYSAVGLTKGGWTLIDSRTTPGGSVQELTFLDATGRELSRFEFATGDHTLEALLDGGVLLTERAGDVKTLTVFDAQGRKAPDAAVALAGLDRTQPVGGLRGVPPQFDERRVLAPLEDEAGKLGLVLFDVVTQQLEPTRSGYVLGDSNFVQTQTGFGGNSRFEQVKDFGAFDAIGFTPLANLSISSLRSEAGPNDNLKRSSEDLIHQVQTRQPVHSNLITLLDFDLQNRRQSTLVTTNTSESDSQTVESAVGNQSNRTRFNLLSRQLINTPFASPTTAASYLALVGAATTPGQSNGSFAPPVVTPPSPPPVTPPSPPPMLPPTPGPVSPPSPSPVTPPAPVPTPTPTPTAPVLSPSRPPVGLSLPIRPPQTEVPPLGNRQPTPPNTERPRGPSTKDVGGGEQDLLEAAAKAEDDLVRDLVCGELSAAECAKYGTGTKEVKKALLKRGTQKQLSGRYWTAIENMDEDTIAPFFQAIGDLQLGGELDGEIGGGLEDALFERPIGPDGKPGASALDRTLGVYDLLVRQATTPAEKKQLRKDFAEDLLDAAKQQVASRKPAPPPPPPPPRAEVTDDMILADEAQIKADAKAQRYARAAEAAAEAASPTVPAP